MFKEIISDLDDLRIWIKSWYFYRKQSIKMRLAIRLADIKQKAFNKRYFIVLLELPTGDKLVSINNTEFEGLKRKRWLPKQMSTLELEKNSFYQTPLTRNNKSTIEERRNAKLKYLKYLKRLKQQ